MNNNIDANNELNLEECFVDTAQRGQDLQKAVLEKLSPPPPIKNETTFDDLPDKIDLGNLSKDEVQFLISMFQKDYIEKVISLLPDKIDLSNLSEGVGWFLKVLTEMGYAEKLITLLPDKMNINDLSGEADWFLDSLISQRHTEKVIAWLPDQIDLNNVGEQAVWFLDKLVLCGHDDEIINKLIGNVINLGSLSQKLGWLLRSLVQRDHVKEIISLLPDEINISNLSEGAGELLESIIEKDYAGRFIDLLPDKVDLSNFGEGASNFLVSLVLNLDSYYDYNFISLLPNKMDLGSLSKGVSRFLNSLIRKKGHIEKILSLLPNKIDLNNFSKEAGVFLNSLIEQGYDEKIIALLPDKINLSNLNEDVGLFLKSLGEKGRVYEIFNKLTNNPVDLNSLNKEMCLFLSLLINKLPEEGKELVEEILERSKISLRRAITINEFEDFQTQETLSLIEIIKTFPISSAKPWRGGWLRAEVEKDGSETYVFFKQSDDGKFKIMFLNDEIGKESLESYRKAAEIIPEYISASAYLELQDNKHPEILMRKKGFKEVYAGPSLGNFDMDNLPPAISTSINSQKEYIKLNLELHKINHGHTHDGNFNIRFLLTDAGGQRTLSFDVNEAIKLAREQNLSLTPIVILRDWDQAES